MYQPLGVLSRVVAGPLSDRRVPYLAPPVLEVFDLEEFWKDSLLLARGSSVFSQGCKSFQEGAGLQAPRLEASAFRVLYTIEVEPAVALRKGCIK